MECLERRYTWQHVISKWWASSGSCVGDTEVQVIRYWLGSALSYWKKKIPGLFLYSAWDTIRKEWFCRLVPSAPQKEVNGGVFIALENIGWEMYSLGEEVENLPFTCVPPAIWVWVGALGLAFLRERGQSGCGSESEPEVRHWRCVCAVNSRPRADRGELRTPSLKWQKRRWNQEGMKGSGKEIGQCI